MITAAGTRDSVVLDGMLWHIIEERGNGYVVVRRRLGLFKVVTKKVRITKEAF